jgi:hypothetical protein
MKQKLEIAAFLVISAVVITFAIKAGQHHETCQQCNWAVQAK